MKPCLKISEKLPPAEINIHITRRFQFNIVLYCFFLPRGHIQKPDKFGVVFFRRFRILLEVQFYSFVTRLRHRFFDTQFNIGIAGILCLNQPLPASGLFVLKNCFFAGLIGYCR